MAETRIDFPLHVDGRGRAAGTTNDDHLRDLIEQVLFTSPGERVNRPTFGAGVLRLVFAPNSPELATATQMLVQGALQQQLSDVIQLEGVEVSADDSTLVVTVRYRGRQSQQRHVDHFSRTIA
jgi:phage baseplate assembly protein W